MIKSTLDSTPVFQPVVTRRASEIIYEEIKERIVRRVLKPGDRLPSEKQLMEMFRRSRPTIREALRMLSSNGYIRTVPGSSGSIVLEMTEKNMEQVITDALQVNVISLAEMAEYRLTLEAAVAEWAATRSTEEELTEIRDVLNEMKSSIDSDVNFAQLDTDFHKSIAKAAHNKIASVMINTAAQINMGFMEEKLLRTSETARKKMRQRVYCQHLAIYEAVASGKADAARENMIVHMHSFLKDLQPDANFE